MRRCSFLEYLGILGVILLFPTPSMPYLPNEELNRKRGTFLEYHNRDRSGKQENDRKVDGNFLRILIY